MAKLRSLRRRLLEYVINIIDGAFAKYWTGLAIRIAKGKTELNRYHLLIIVDQIDFKNMKPEFLPNSDLAVRNTKGQKRAGLKLVEDLWGLTSKDLMKLERGWLDGVRQRSGFKTKDDSKDDETELVTPQLLARIVAVAYVYYSETHSKDYQKLCDEARYSLNLFIANSCHKGRTRATILESNSAIYNKLRDLGVIVGCSGMFLPDPETSLPHIFSLLMREKLRPEVYRE